MARKCKIDKKVGEAFGDGMTNPLWRNVFNSSDPVSYTDFVPANHPSEPDEFDRACREMAASCITLELYFETEIGGVVTFFNTLEAAQSAREEWSAIESGRRIAETNLFVGWWGLTGATSTFAYWGRMIEEQGDAIMEWCEWKGLVRK